MKKRTHLTWDQLRELGVEAEVDARTLEKVLAGDPIKGRAVLKRAVAVLIKHGHLNPDGSPKPPSTPAAGADA